jgi:hypothetical protein
MVDFISRNKDLMRKMKDITTISSRRILAAKADCEEKLADLALFTEALVKKYDDKGNDSATLGAIKMLNITLMNYMKIAGFVDDGSKSAEYSGDDVMRKVSEKNKSLGEKVMDANFKFIENEEPIVVEKKESSDE